MKTGIFALALLAIILAGCTNHMSFDDAATKINEINSKYSATMESYPASIEQVDQMISEFNQLKDTKLSSKQEQFDYGIKYRVLSLEAGRYYLEGTKYGTITSTKNGFSCRPRPLILESANLRNQSVQKSYEAVTLLRQFVEKYPNDASKLGLLPKIAVFQNATAYRTYEELTRDIKVIKGFCPENKTLEIYKDYLNGRGNYSEDFINNLSYNEAAEIWMKIRGFD